MRSWKIAWVVAVVIAAAAVSMAADSRSYGKSIELVWDDAVKAARDVELVVTDSDRTEHWFTMETPKKTLARTARFEVQLTESGSGTQVTVKATEDAGSSKSEKTIARYLDALEHRLR